MNTLAWMSAAGACMWLALYCFNSLDQDGLGIVVLMVFLLCLVQVLVAAWDDFRILFGRGGD